MFVLEQSVQDENTRTTVERKTVCDSDSDNDHLSSQLSVHTGLTWKAWALARSLIGEMFAPCRYN